MAYYREVRIDELVAWLQSREYSNNGAIKVDLEVLATDLLEKFDILGYSTTAV